MLPPDTWFSFRTERTRSDSWQLKPKMKKKKKQKKHIDINTGPPAELNVFPVWAHVRSWAADVTDPAEIL